MSSTSRRAFLAWIAVPLLAHLPCAQTPAWSPDTAAPGIAGRVFSLATWRGELHAGGFQFWTHGQRLQCIARFDGERWRPLGAGVDAPPNRDATVNAMVEFGGELVAAGTFVSAGGRPANGIASWDGTTWRPLGSGLTLSFGLMEVNALAVWNGALWAAGSFDTAGGQPALGFARWDGQTWSAVGAGFTDSVSQTLSPPHALQVHGTRLYVGGEFDRADNVAARHVAAFDGTTFTPLGQGTDATVYALESYLGELIAGGGFSTAGGQTAPMVAAWTGTAWHALGSNGPDLPVKAVRRLGAHLYAGGLFTNAGSRLARWDGSAWSNPGGLGGVFSGITDTRVETLHAHGAELVIGGDFTRGGPRTTGPTAVVSTCAIAFDGNATWRQLGAGLGLDGVVHRLVPYGDGWVAAGNFSEAGGVHAVGIARFDGDRWHRLGTFDGEVAEAVVFRGDLVVSGGFRTIDGQPIANIARFDGTAWTPFGTPRIAPLAVFGSDLYAGSTNALLRWNGTDFVTVTPVSGIVGKLHVHADGRLYAATTTSSQQRVYAWDGSVLTQVGTPNAPVHAIGSHGPHLVLGGRFTSVSGTPANLIARWDGISWSALPAVTGYSVDSFAELEGDLYAGVSGDPRGFLLRLRGSTWQGLGTGPEGLPLSLFPDRATASVWAGGAWFAIGTLPSRNLAVWQNQPAWQNRLHGRSGRAGVPLLAGRGELRANTPFALTVEAHPAHAGVLVLGASRVDWPLFGGTLVPDPRLLIPLQGDGQGRSGLGSSWPVGIPPQSGLFLQAWLLDALAPMGMSASNALQATAQ